MHTPILITALLLTLTLTACGKKEEAAAPDATAPSAAPAPPAPSAEPSAPAASAVVAAGESKYRTVCAVCHGQNAEGMGNYPRLAGLTRDEIRNKLMDYRAGKRMGPLTAIMAATAKDLTDADIEALAAYLGK
jgi:cytochrome c553